jgi:hypothetical protein
LKFEKKKNNSKEVYKVKVIQKKNIIILDTMDHHNPHHWGYISTPTTHNTWTPPSTRSKLKRERALSESDGDDIYSEESSKEQ